ncbi:hypothetical protein AB0D54_27095 [Streptomyces xanthophaeus]|uniref:hypothetical protein n=1 Tax=Streptomyces xanthophaeus TaxID=67385 RepID=UPI00343A7044
MKLSKVAAVLAGSVAALGASAPAFASDAQAVPMSLTSGVTSVTEAVNPVSEGSPQIIGNALAEQGAGIDKVLGTVQKVNEVRNSVPSTLLGLANGATQSQPELLGGVHLNGGGH